MQTIDKKQWIDQLEKALNDIRPHLKEDGGDVEVVDITEELGVKIRWLGNCENCSMSAMTMRAGIEESLKSKFPEISSVEAVNGIQ